MGSGKPSYSKEQRAPNRPGILVGRAATVRSADKQPPYFTARHRQWIGKTGRIHAVVPATSRENPLVKVGFDSGTQIVFFRLGDLEVRTDTALATPRRHGKRGSQLPPG